MEDFEFSALTREIPCICPGPLRVGVHGIQEGRGLAGRLQRSEGVEIGDPLPPQFRVHNRYNL